MSSRLLISLVLRVVLSCARPAATVVLFVRVLPIPMLPVLPVPLVKSSADTRPLAMSPGALALVLALAKVSSPLFVAGSPRVLALPVRRRLLLSQHSYIKINT
jgi:hypothetical protein